MVECVADRPHSLGAKCIRMIFNDELILGDRFARQLGPLVGLELPQCLAVEFGFVEIRFEPLDIDRAGIRPLSVILGVAYRKHQDRWISIIDRNLADRQQWIDVGQARFHPGCRQIHPRPDFGLDRAN